MSANQHRNGLILTLVGFSGIGKSHLAAALARDCGWKCYCCDDMIEERLRKEHDLPTEKGIRGVADWLGFPDEDGFVEREAAYLHREDEVMSDLLSTIDAAHAAGDNIVLDASGSLVYCQQKVLDEVCRKTDVVYLEASADDEVLLLEQYLRDPKPLVWQNHFAKVAGESQIDAIRRCFPILFRDRKWRYEAMAKQTIPILLKTRSNFTPAHFLDHLKST